MIRKNRSKIDEAFEARAPIHRALRDGVADARKAHRQAGVPMVTCREGRVVWVDPETLEEVPEPEFAKRRD